MKQGRRGFLGLFGGAVAAATIAPKVIEAAQISTPALPPPPMDALQQFAGMPSSSDFGVVTTSMSFSLNLPMQYFPKVNYPLGDRS